MIGRVRVPACLLTLLLGLGADLLAPPASLADDGDVTKPLAPSNTALLSRAALGAAHKLVARVPLTPGTKVGLRSETGGDLDADMREALLQALNERKIACVLLPPAGGDTTAAAPPRPTRPGGPANADGAASTPTPPPSGDLAALTRQAAAQEQQQEQGSFDALQEERRAQAARADSLARAGGGGTAPAGTSVLATPPMPVLTWRVQEARVDYVRMFRGGIFGAQRVERRARADLALRLTQPGTDAVTWSASADSTVGDVVLKSEIKALEDRTRPETRPELPSNSFKKVLEPALVVILIAGLVSLFYQNRP